MADIVIAGYLGFANSGDEALLSILLSKVRCALPGKTVTVLSMRPRRTAREYGVRAIHRYDVAAIAREFSRSRVLVFGGGSLLQDATSRRSLYYYLFLLWLSKRCGMKTMLFANGIGPLRRGLSRRLTACVLSGVDEITLRDGDSAALLRELGVTRGRVTADAAFMLAGGGEARPGDAPGEKYAVVSVRPTGRGRHGLVSATAATCRHLYAEHNIVPMLVPMQYPRDIRAIRRVARAAGVPVRVREGTFSAEDALSVLSGAELAVGMRLHLLIFAAAAGTPPVGISYDPKVGAFCRGMGVPSVGMDDGAEALCRAVDLVISRRSELSARVRIRAEELSELAAENVEILKGLL